MKEILIFGSSGSIGKNAIDIIKRNKNFKIKGLCVFRNIKSIYFQIKNFFPKYVCVVDEKSAEKLEKIIDKKIKLFKGPRGLEEFSSLNSDISVMAIPGIFCLKPILINLKFTKRIALANKESLVVSGDLIFKEAKKFSTEILPVDSEINALFQLFNMNSQFEKIYLTASGGPLIDYKKRDLNNVSVNKVLAHPTWKMGKRITVDSATLVNKGFEVIEAHHFFKIPYNRIEIIVHRESNVHALVECKDKTLFACMYLPDMRIPLSFTFFYPSRYLGFKGINFNKKNVFSFEPIDYKKFPLVKLILTAAEREDNSLVILNACDEVAIEYFLKNKIKFIDLYKAMEYIFRIYPSVKLKSLDDIFYWDKWAREKIVTYFQKIC